MRNSGSERWLAAFVVAALLLIVAAVGSLIFYGSGGSAPAPRDGASPGAAKSRPAPVRPPQPGRVEAPDAVAAPGTESLAAHPDARPAVPATGPGSARVRLVQSRGRAPLPGIQVALE